MGEYAIRKEDGAKIKIGTCSSMYYIRYEDRFKVSQGKHSLDCSKEFKLRWRIPFPDEDNVKIGEYEPYDRALELNGSPADVVESPGSIRMEDKSGLIVDVKCYHGHKLPTGGDIVHSEWKQSTFADFENPAKANIKSCFLLESVYNMEEGVRFLITCKDCGQSFLCEFEEIENFIEDEELKERLRAYTQS